MDGQEIGRVFQLFDELQLVRDPLLDVGRNSPRPATLGGLMRPVGQRL
jgi:hypothetical protein